MSKKNELAPTVSALPALITNYGQKSEEDVFQVGADNMGGAKPELSAIKISKEVCAFQFNETVLKEFTGHILHHHKARAYWVNEDAVTNSPPDCCSMDGKFADPSCADKCPISNQVRAANTKLYKSALVCDTCPMSAFRSAKAGKGKGKACKEMHRFFALVIDPIDQVSIIPYRMSASPGSLKEVSKYLTHLTGKGIHFATVPTKFSLRRAKSSDGFDYAILVMSTDIGKKLGLEDQKRLAKLIETYRGGFDSKAVFVSDAQETPADGASSMPPDEPRPSEESIPF